jgi:hypothetical protein
MRFSSSFMGLITCCSVALVTAVLALSPAIEPAQAGFYFLYTGVPLRDTSSHGHRLDIHKFPDPKTREFPAETGLLDTAKR